MSTKDEITGLLQNRTKVKMDSNKSNLILLGSILLYK